jgi:four helix bundle protein
MATIKRFEDLEIWKQARILNTEIFNICRLDLFSKDYALKDQLRRASGSIMNNIAEGFERGGNKEFIQFLYIAIGSNGEVRSMLYQVLDFNYIIQEKFEELYNQSNQISALIHNFINYLSASALKGQKYIPKP